MVKQKEMVKLENWLNRKMVQWKHGKMETLVKQKSQLNRKNKLNRKIG